MWFCRRLACKGPAWWSWLKEMELSTSRSTGKGCLEPRTPLSCSCVCMRMSLNWTASSSRDRILCQTSIVRRSWRSFIKEGCVIYNHPTRRAVKMRFALVFTCPLQWLITVLMRQYSIVLINAWVTLDRLLADLSINFTTTPFDFSHLHPPSQLGFASLVSHLKKLQIC